MKKVLVFGALLSVFFIPSVSHAAITITNVTVNGASTTTVRPLSTVRVAMTVQVTQGSKWEGIKWGINNNGQVVFPAFVNLDDNDRRDHDGEGWRDDDHKGNDDYRNSCNQNHNGGNGTFTEKFYIIAPFKVGLYDANFLAFEKKKGNNKPLASGSVFVLPNAVRVATTTTTPPPPPADTTAPVIAAHADVFATATNASGTVVTYTDPTATDNVDASVAVSCIPASGSTFAVGTTTVSCDASDAAGNAATPSIFNVVVAPLPDTQAPVIAAHEDISVVGTSAGAAVTYINPTANDNVDALVAVACSPASGSTFAIGSTTVTCTAHDIAGNNAIPTTFTVGVVAPPPTPFTMATQADESFLCANDWRNCFTSGIAQTAINLGQGSGLGSGTLLSVTVAKDENSEFVTEPWTLQIQCYTDSTYATTCTDWVAPNAWNGFRTYLVTESSTTTTDGKHWTAYFTTSNEGNFGTNSSPVVINPNYFYRLIINDGGWNIGAYGSESPAIPYYKVTGMTL